MYCLQYVKVVFNWVNKESQMPTASCSLHPDVQHFSRKYHHLPTNIFGRTFHPPRAFCVLESLRKNSSPRWGKDKQTLSSRRYLARVLSSLMYRYGLRPKWKRVCGS